MGIIRNHTFDNIIYSKTNPKINENPSIKNILYINTTSGEIFTCVDNTLNRNIWKGQRGSIIGMITDNTDPFEDGSCISTYKFDDNIEDLNNSFNCSWSGTPQYDNGKFGKCVKFNGSNAITINNNVSSFQNKTISLWYKDENPDDNTSRAIYQEAIRTDSPYNGIQIWAGYSDNNLTLRTQYGNNITIEPLINLRNSFNHICVTYDMTVCSLYLNGILKGTINDTTDLSNLISNVTLGCNFDNTNIQNLYGYIDQLRIFNRALTSIEVHNLYNENNIS